ncbi:MAG: hypothetical protein ABW076_04580 [Candidatus Thiodiazotropha sp.]
MNRIQQALPSDAILGTGPSPEECQSNERQLNCCFGGFRDTHHDPVRTTLEPGIQV